MAPLLTALSPWLHRLEPHGRMRVPGLLLASEALLAGMEERVFQQLSNVACLPGIVNAALAMPDAHSGYGFPIGGVGAFDPRKGGVVSAGGVGFDIACGVRALTTGIAVDELLPQRKEAADALFRAIPAGLGKGGEIRLRARDMDAMLAGGAQWAVSAGFGEQADLERCEEGGRMAGAEPDKVSDQARKRQEEEMGTLGSGNHYLELQVVERVLEPEAARDFGLVEGQALVSIHCGSRGLGHQIGTDYLKLMAQQAKKHGLELPDRELACAPYYSELGQDYLGAMRAGINCALANRQILTHLARQTLTGLFPNARIRLLYDVSHNTCKEEDHEIEGRRTRLLVHRKGATRALPPGHPELPAAFRRSGQPVLIGGSMGTASYILAGRPGGAAFFHSANHGAGRVMSRSQAKKRYDGRNLLADLEARGVFVRADSLRGLAEEAPGAYKDVDEVVRVVAEAGLAAPVARLLPLVCVKG